MTTKLQDLYDTDREANSFILLCASALGIIAASNVAMALLKEQL